MLCYLCVCVLTIVDRGVCVKSVGVEGLFVTHWGRYVNNVD